MQDNNQNKDQNGNKKRLKFDIVFLIILVLLAIGIWMFISNMSSSSTRTLTYDEFTQEVAKGTITSGSGIQAKPITGDSNSGLYQITGTLTEQQTNSKGEKVDVDVKFNLIVTKEVLNNLVDKSTLNIKVTAVSSNTFLSIVITLLPYVVTLVILYFVFKSISKSAGGAGGAFDFAKSTAKLNRVKTVKFSDVAGCDEEKEELVEIIDFLKNPRKYNEIGARIPKGVILFGPPGTGKTLLAKAVAGEAGVPFFSISGSDFVEMFVGVGASRIRDMFKTAKQNAPCIVFIDEIDAVGRQRGAGMGGGNDEREQTLNQLLVEMDGFEGNTGIIIMAATNRPDVLDPALLRPGRFDRQITISNPDVRGREAILKVHARNKHLDPKVKLDEVAQRTPGFSGADLENLLNEAALLAARENRRVINLEDIDEATDRVMMGPAKKSRTYTERERRLVAYHEAGHAVIGLKLEDASVVQKITIVPRGQAGGYNLMMPKEETYFRTKKQLLDTITGYLGGRVAEEIMFKDVSTGASNDFENATALARSMVTQYGMSPLGPIQYEKSNGSVFLGRDYLKDKNFSDEVGSEIDKEERKIIEECYKKATDVISANMDLLTNIAEYLLKLETITKPEIDEIAATGHLAWYDNKVKAAENIVSSLDEETKTEESTTDSIKSEDQKTSSENENKDAIESEDDDIDFKALTKTEEQETKDENNESKDDTNETR